MEDDEDGDDIDPRTLAEAAARLAKYTSEAEVTPGSLPQDQWADIYKESAGEDRSGEAAVEFLAVRAAGQPQGAATAAGATPGEGAAGSACYWRLSAGPHKVGALGGALVFWRGQEREVVVWDPGQAVLLAASVHWKTAKLQHRSCHTASGIGATKHHTALEEHT